MLRPVVPTRSFTMRKRFAGRRWMRSASDGAGRETAAAAAHEDAIARTPTGPHDGKCGRTSELYKSVAFETRDRGVRSVMSAASGKSVAACWGTIQLRASC